MTLLCLKAGVMSMFIGQLGGADENTQQTWHPKYGQMEKKSRAKYSDCPWKEEGRVWKGNAGSERKEGGEKEEWASGEGMARWTSSGRPLWGRMKELPRDAWVYQVARGNKEVPFLVSLLSAIGGLLSVVNWLPWLQLPESPWEETLTNALSPFSQGLQEPPGQPSCGEGNRIMTGLPGSASGNQTQAWGWCNVSLASSRAAGTRRTIATEPLGLFTQPGQWTHTKHCQTSVSMLPLLPAFIIIWLLWWLLLLLLFSLLSLTSTQWNLESNVEHTDATKNHFLSCLPRILSFSFIGLKPAEVWGLSLAHLTTFRRPAVVCHPQWQGPFWDTDGRGLGKLADRWSGEASN